MVAPRIIQCDARSLPLDTDSVDLVVTSPPYFGMRSYRDGGKHYASQLGGEATPVEYVTSLVQCTREMVRVLKPSGSLWVNLGDKYGGAAWETKHGQGARQITASGGLTAGRPYIATEQGRVTDRSIPGTRHKSLIGIPWRYALRCVDDLGLILRAEVIWSKPNGLPESVRDRVKRSHETWFHFTLASRYFSAVDELREPTQNRPGLTWDERRNRADSRAKYSPENGHGGSGGMADNPLGKLPSSVWTVATQPLRVPPELGVDHFAAFPMELPRRIILGWSPRDVCSACGEGRRPIVRRPGLTGHDNNPDSRNGAACRSALDGGSVEWAARQAHPDYVSGYACACPDVSAPAMPGVVLDPFGGSGTTALVASVLGRQGISVDASADYCRLATWRCADERERARVGRQRPEPKARPAS